MTPPEPHAGILEHASGCLHQQSRRRAPTVARVPRMSSWAAAAVLLLIPVAFINPAQVMVIIQGLCKIALAAWVGYWIDRCAAPYARPHELIQRLPQDARAIVVNVAFGAASLRRGIIMSAAMIALAIGL